MVWVEQLEAKQGEDDLNGEGASVHKVAIEELEAVVKVSDAQLLRLLTHFQPKIDQTRKKTTAGYE